MIATPLCLIFQMFFLNDTNIHTLCIKDELYHFRIVTCIFEQLNGPEMAQLVFRVFFRLFWLKSGRWGMLLNVFCLGLQVQSNWSLSSWAYEQLCMRNNVVWISSERLNFECWTSLSEKTFKSLIMKYDYTLFHCEPAEILLYLSMTVCLANVLLSVLSEIWPLSKSLS